MKIELKNKHETIETIEKIESFDLSSISIKDLEEELSLLLKGFKIVVPRFNPGIYLYRGRVCDKPLNAYSGPFRPLIPIDSGHPFRTIPATDSD